MDDLELLRQYATHSSEAAFETLVQRHVNLVYSAACRQVHDSDLAREVTQTVFIILARKAHTLRPGTILSGWLYRTAQFAGAKALRTETRRRSREQEAARMETDQTDSTWERIAPLLEEAMSHLGDADRNAVVLRYFENKSLSAIGAALGTNEDSAQKRVTRAVEKLRAFFTKRGVVLSAALLTSVLSAQAVQAAPAGMASAAAAAAALKGSTAATSTATLIKGALKLMVWTKAKTAIVVGAGILLATGTATVTVYQIWQLQHYRWRDMVDGGDQALRALDITSPQVTVVPSKFMSDQPYNRLQDDIGSPDRWRFIGVHASPSEILRVAYNDPTDHVNNDRPFLVVSPPAKPGPFYDYIANLPNGSREALQALVKKKFGLVGKYEMRDMDVLLLQVGHPGAPRMLKRGTAQPPSPTRVADGFIHYRNRPLSKLAQRLEVGLQIPVIDRTGLAGNYDFDFPDDLGVTPSEKLENARRVLLHEFGLTLVPSREPHEVFVIERGQ